MIKNALNVKSTLIVIPNNIVHFRSLNLKVKNQLLKNLRLIKGGGSHCVHPYKGGSAVCSQNAFRGRGGVKKGPKTAVILNVWPHMHLTKCIP